MDAYCGKYLKTETLIELINESFEDIKVMFELIFIAPEIRQSKPLQNMKILHKKICETRKINRIEKIVEQQQSHYKSAPTFFNEGMSSSDIQATVNMWFENLFESIMKEELKLYSLKGHGMFNAVQNNTISKEISECNNFTYNNAFIDM